MSDGSSINPPHDETLFHDPAQGTAARSRAQGRPADEIPDALGPYEIIDLIGHGGMGLVLRGRDGALKREVAIKVLQPDSRARPADRMRFMAEGPFRVGFGSSLPTN